MDTSSDVPLIRKLLATLEETAAEHSREPDGAEPGASAAAALLPMVYDQLRALAASYLQRERPDHTLQPTALVHEAYVRLARTEGLSFSGEAHFFAVAAKAIRQVLVDHARSHQALKRGRAWGRVSLEHELAATTPREIDVLDLDEAMSALVEEHGRPGRVAELRFFGGLTTEQAAHVLGSPARRPPRTGPSPARGCHSGSPPIDGAAPAPTLHPCPCPCPCPCPPLIPSEEGRGRGTGRSKDEGESICTLSVILYYDCMSLIEFTLDPGARSPLYRQLQDQIRYAISVGELGPGDALPSIRELEARLDVNRNTVRRAYLELQIEGTLVVRQGREAVVADRPPATRPMDLETLHEDADALAASLLQRAESIGLDCLQVANHFASVARRHDATYPRCAFVECSQRQADFFARQAQSRFGRHFVGVDLHDLERDAAAMPASVRFVLTPHWHSAEATQLCHSETRAVHAVGVRIEADCGQELRGLEGTIGLVVRDPESMPGFRERLQSQIGQPSIRTALCDDRQALEELLQEVNHVVYTSPCTDTVQALAPKRLATHELIFEPTPEDLDAVRAEIFPSLFEEVQST